MKILRLLILTTATLWTNALLACSCVNVIVDTSIVVKHTPTIVKGVIIEQRSVNDTIQLADYSYVVKDKHYTMIVSRVFAGSKSTTDTLTIVSRAEGGTCGYEFILGNEYIVFSTDYSEEFIRTDICTLTSEYYWSFEERIKKELGIKWP